MKSHMIDRSHSLSLSLWLEKGGGGVEKRERICKKRRRKMKRRRRMKRGKRSRIDRKGRRKKGGG